MDLDTSLNILAIDIGILNLGYVYANVIFKDYSPEYEKKSIKINKCFNKRNNYERYSKKLNECLKKEINVFSCDRIDITECKHIKVHRSECKLEHESCIPDYLDHFIQENSFIFENAEIIILERQPPVGITNVQDLIFTRFRNKVKLISPNTIHKFFKMTRSEYEIRKIESEKITSIYLETFKNFTNNCRRHDISDAMLMIIYYFKTRVVKKKSIVIDYFEQFKFNKINNKLDPNFFERFRFNFNKKIIDLKK
jgi:hypothetical protein